MNIIRAVRFVILTADRLVQLVEQRTAVQEVAVQTSARLALRVLK